MNIVHRDPTTDPAPTGHPALGPEGHDPGSMRGRLGRPILIAALATIAVPAPALAYIGPGVGLGAVAVAVALVLGLFLLVVGLVWFPLKRLLKRRRHRADTHGRPTDPE